MALFALVIVGALVAGGYLVAVRQWRATGAGSQGGAALYAADAGLNAGLARLDLGVLDSVRPGDGLTLAKGSLVSGDEYSVRLSRWDAGHDSGPAYFLIASEGRAHGARGGRRQVAAMVRKAPGGDFCCGAGLEARGAVRLDSGAVISGLDIVPDSWAVDAELCGDTELHDRPGIVTDGQVLPAAGALVQGTPPVASPGSTDEFGDSGRWLQELAVSADLRYPGGTVLANVGPAAWANGECGRSSPSNWGAPAAPGHPCFTYFPVIHAAGDLIVGASASGQGILLVDGDLEIRGGFEFYGVILVGGGLTAGPGGGRVLGGARVGGLGSGSVRVGGGGEVHYSSCAVERAVEGSKVQAPHPLAQFGWFEILE